MIGVALNSPIREAEGAWSPKSQRETGADAIVDLESGLAPEEETKFSALVAGASLWRCFSFKIKRGSPVE